jgi:hypothetical protein
MTEEKPNNWRKWIFRLSTSSIKHWYLDRYSNTLPCIRFDVTGMEISPQSRTSHT